MSSVILLGPPGAGKGTQRVMLTEKYGFKEIIPGDLMREEVKNMTPDGIILANYINNGLLAPHDLVMKIVKSTIEIYFKEGAKNIIFDGFPREIEQFDAINDILKEYNDFKITKVFLLKVDSSVVVERIKNRALTSGRADDTDEKVINKRLEIYYESTSKVLDRYKKIGILIEIDANKSVGEVFRDIDSFLNEFK